MRKDFQVKDHSVSQEVFTLRYDEHHDMFYTIPKPSAEKLPAYYESEDYISHTDSKRSLFEWGYHIVKGITLSRKRKLIHSYLPKTGSILDVGAGTGDFLKVMSQSGWQAQGVEPDENARKIAEEKSVRIVSQLPEGKNQYDAITMWHVLEHVYDLEAQIDWIQSHLTPDGCCFIAVPNYKSYDAEHYQSFWAAYDVPRHLYHFSKKAIQKLFATAQLEVVEIHPMKFDAYYVSLLSEKYKNDRMNFMNALRVGWKSNRKARKEMNYSSHIYVIKHKKRQN